MQEKTYDILYKGRRLYQNLTLESCSEVLQDLSELFCSGGDIDPNLIELEEIQNGIE
jgi:hypothetical protein